MELVAWISLAVSVISLVLILALLAKSKPANGNDYTKELMKIETLVSRLDTVFREEMSSSRMEQSRRMTEFEGSIINKLTQISGTQQEQLNGITKANSEVISKMSVTVEQTLTSSRAEQSKRLSDFEQALLTKLSQMAANQQEQLTSITKTNNDVVTKMSETVDKKLDDVKLSVESKLREIQTDNGEKLEKMRQTVDEKLHKTLEERLGQSFRLVSERLEQVQKGLGEMQTLAVGVGDLKKVLSNVKTRGIMGEIQLGSILEQILSVEQYDKNVSTNPHSHDVVEFAIRLPGKEMDGSTVYLPVDSKFPIEAYYKLMESYDKASVSEIDQAGKAMEAAIKKSAKDIHDKYIYPPNTTDFGVMFLPIEGLYAEIVRRPLLLEVLQRDYKIIVAGPTTFAALLNSLQMGFKTLAIEKRSSEVWNILSAVKTEFSKFGDVLEKAQRKITDAGTEIEKLVGVRSKKIIRSLSQVSELKQSDAQTTLLLDIAETDAVTNEEDDMEDDEFIKGLAGNL